MFPGRGILTPFHQIPLENEMYAIGCHGESSEIKSEMISKLL